MKLSRFTRRARSICISMGYGNSSERIAAVAKALRDEYKRGYNKGYAGK